MYGDGEDVFYYVTVTNENYPQPQMPQGAEHGILRGMHRVADAGDAPVRARLLGSGPMLNEALRARDLLSEGYDIACEVWSVTSYKELHKDALETERWNNLHPDEAARIPYIAQCLADGEGPIVAVSDYVKALPESVSSWVPGRLVSLGTDGFGRSDGRPALRDFFEIDAKHIAWATLAALARDGVIEAGTVTKAMNEWDIDAEKANPMSL
jgi:pyruvate dehydrogenase E1 component